MMTVPGADGCFQSVDDGGDATFLVHKGKELEVKYAEDGFLPDPACTDTPCSIFLTLFWRWIKVGEEDTPCSLR